MWNNAKWIGISKEQIRAEQIYAGDLNGRFAYFRKQVVCGEQPGSCVIQVTANTRYRLWINGKPVLSGPCKGDWHSHYYETVDVTEYLKTGKNVFAAQVLFLNPFDVGEQYGNERTPILAAVSAPVGHRLAVEGVICNRVGEPVTDITTGIADWQVYLDSAYYIRCKEINCNSGGFCEDIDFRKEPAGWKEPGYCGQSGSWWSAVSFESVLPDEFSRNVGFVRKFQVKERPIPLLFEEEGSLSEELGTSVFRDENGTAEEIVIAPKEMVRIVFSCPTVINAYMRYAFSGGEGGRVTFTYFEKFVKEGEDIPRDDYVNGRVEGMTDEILLSGETFTFEPFWVRTFRFLEIVLAAGEEPIRFSRPRYRRTGYPVKRISWIKGEEPWVEPVWEMCVTTLQNCMLETYMDCPFYEQMQFLMDTRLQALFHYALDGDTRLAKKALWDFHCSMTPEGLMHGKYPSSFPQIISTFSLYFVYMLWEYYWQTGDADEVKRYRSDVDAILEYYDRRIGASGLAEQIGYWPFVDWQKEWADTAGVPSAAKEGPSTIHNLMYAYALLCASWLADATGRSGLAQEYRNRQQQITGCVRELCWDKDRQMYREGPDVLQFSQHAQSWAALNGMGEKEERRRMLLLAMREPDVIRCSFSTSYELFRALEQEGLYGETKPLMARWSGLLEKHCTTCPEEPESGRSENHAWSALPMYEMMRKLAGVEAAEPGWKSVRIQPHLEYVTGIKGQAATPKGAVSFWYRPAAEAVQEDDAFRNMLAEAAVSVETQPDRTAVMDKKKWICCFFTLPAGMSGELILPDGSSRKLSEGENRILIKRSCS